MGALDKLLTFGNSKKGKIVSWSMVVLFSVVFFTGIALNFINPNSTKKIQSLNMVAPNMVFRSNFSGTNTNDTPDSFDNAYFLTITQRYTFVNVLPIGNNSSAMVKFTTSSAYIGFEKDTVPAGGVLTIKLLKDSEGNYGFSDRDPKVRVDENVIKVTANGNSVATIYVRILLNDNDFTIDTILQRRTLHGLWEDAPNNAVETQYLSGNATNNPTYGDWTYRVHITFKIWDDIIYDSDPDRDGFDNFNYRELYTIYDPLYPPDYNTGAVDSRSGLGNADTLNLFKHGYTNSPAEDTVKIANGLRIDSNCDVYYAISCIYNERDFTKSNFRISIIYNG